MQLVSKKKINLGCSSLWKNPFIRDGGEENWEGEVESVGAEARAASPLPGRWHPRQGWQSLINPSSALISCAEQESEPGRQSRTGQHKSGAL